MKNAEIVADSLNTATGDRLTTFVLPRLPKCFLAEAGTHRILNADALDEPITERLNPFGQEFSRNAASSRAIPINKVIERIKEDPYIPRFTKHQPGMQGIEGDSKLQDEAERVSLALMDEAIHWVEKLIVLGVHKQNANRYLEPWMRVPVIVSGTEWDNFFKLRCDKSTYPDFRDIAIEMQQLYQSNEPEKLKPGEWHMPMFNLSTDLLEREFILKAAVSRCARVSYLNHDGSEISPEQDYKLHDRLLESKHMSPFEHCAMATEVCYKNIPHWNIDPHDGNYKGVYCRNYKGFYSYRAHIEDGQVMQ